METFSRYWPFVRGIHPSPVNSPHKGQWRRALMFSLICAWIYSRVNNREAGDLRRYRAHYDVIVMSFCVTVMWCRRRSVVLHHSPINPDSKVRGANMGPIWGRQDPGGPHVGPMNLAIWEYWPLFGPRTSLPPSSQPCTLIGLRAAGTHLNTPRNPQGNYGWYHNKVQLFLWPAYSGRPRSTPWLLLSRALVSPGLQLSWYCLCGRKFWQTTENANILYVS